MFNNQYANIQNLNSILEKLIIVSCFSWNFIDSSVDLITDINIVDYFLWSFILRVFFSSKILIRFIFIMNPFAFNAKIVSETDIHSLPTNILLFMINYSKITSISPTRTVLLNVSLLHP